MDTKSPAVNDPATGPSPTYEPASSMPRTTDTPHTNGSSSKAPDSEGHLGGFVATTKMAVQPPKKEDLQKTYATTVPGESNPKGWYGSMINTLGACIGTMGAIPCCIVCPNPYKSVNQGNVGLVTKFGRF